MFVVYVGSILTTILFFQALVGEGEAPPGFILARPLWLWFTVLFANFAEAMAEGRGKAQAERCAARARDVRRRSSHEPQRGANWQACAGVDACARGDVVLVEAGDFIPGDGEVIEGVASVDESAITGESRAGHPRERRRPQLGHRRHARAVRLARRARHREPRRDLPRPHDRAGRRRQRQKTPNEIALDILLAALTIIFLLATVTLLPYLDLQRRRGDGRARRSRSPCWSRCSSA